MISRRLTVTTRFGVPALLPFARNGRGDHNRYQPTPNEIMEFAHDRGATVMGSEGPRYCVDFGFGPRLWTRHDLIAENWKH